MSKLNFVTDRVVVGFFIVSALLLVGSALGFILYKILAAYGWNVMAAAIAAGQFIGVVLGIVAVLFFVGYLAIDIREKVGVLLNDGD